MGLLTWPVRMREKSPCFWSEAFVIPRFRETFGVPWQWTVMSQLSWRIEQERYFRHLACIYQSREYIRAILSWGTVCFLWGKSAVYIHSLILRLCQLSWTLPRYNLQKSWLYWLPDYTGEWSRQHSRKTLRSPSLEHTKTTSATVISEKDWDLMACRRSCWSPLLLALYSYANWHYTVTTWRSTCKKVGGKLMPFLK